MATIIILRRGLTFALRVYAVNDKKWRSSATIGKRDAMVCGRL
jgi:hypothetical protein